MRQVDDSDLWKIHDALHAAFEHHKYRDVSNGYLHLAKETRYSPLTSELGAALDRVKLILEPGGGEPLDLEPHA